MEKVRFAVLLGPAAFRRLCVETAGMFPPYCLASQPPSGGCVLKQFLGFARSNDFYQPPSGGCVLKQAVNGQNSLLTAQPPSGGCVLKQLTVTLNG